MSPEPDQDQIDEARHQQRHDMNLGRPERDGDEAPRTLEYISEPEESVDSPTEALEWINSKSASTTNLTSEDVVSKGWVLEYHQLLSRMEHPPEYGLARHERAWAYDAAEEWRKPLGSEDFLELEGYTEIGKEATARSKDGWGVETATRDTKESIVREDKDKSGGLLGKIRR